MEKKESGFFERNGFKRVFDQFTGTETQKHLLNHGRGKSLFRIGAFALQGDVKRAEITQVDDFSVSHEFRNFLKQRFNNGHGINFTDRGDFGNNS